MILILLSLCSFAFPAQAHYFLLAFFLLFVARSLPSLLPAPDSPSGAGAGSGSRSRPPARSDRLPPKDPTGRAPSAALDAERISSFRESLVNLREAMKQRQNSRSTVRRSPSSSSSGGGRGGSQPADGTPPSSSGAASSVVEGAIPPASASSPKPPPDDTLWGWFARERESIMWIAAIASLGFLLGFGVGAGWLTRGAGCYRSLVKTKRVLGAMSAKTGYVPKRAVKQFVVTAWRSDLARRIRRTAFHQLVTLKGAPWKTLIDAGRGALGLRGGGGTTAAAAGRHWIAASPLWPPNWILFREVDLSQIDVGEGGLSPALVSVLSFVLPWRRGLIRALARKDRSSGAGARGSPREQGAGGTPPPSSSSSLASSLTGSLLSSSGGTPSAQPVNPYFHPMAFHTLREYVIRFEGGYVHPDLGFLVPAPSGADRGLGMVRDTFHKCQVHCYPGTAAERLETDREARELMDETERQAIAERELMEEMRREFPEIETPASTPAAAPSPPGHGHSHAPPPQRPERPSPDPARNTTTYEGIQAAVQQQLSASRDRPYTQSEVLLRIPLEAQVTRKTALETLRALHPPEQNTRYAHLEELDDAFLLALYLAHERGLGVNSRVWPYVATLPLRPMCALHYIWRQSVVDVVTAMSVEMGTDVQGWPNEISKAADMFERIVATLSRASSETLATRAGAEDVTENIRWALCQVASRAVAGSDRHGSLRLVPVMDLINHDAAAGEFEELTGDERVEDGSFLDADETDAGTFVVRSRRHGDRKPLRRGQELMANYNVENYSPLDWFLNMGFFPPERGGKWTMLEAGLPRSYRGGFSRKSNAPTKDSGAFGSGKPEIQVIRQHTQQHSCAR